MALVQPFTLRAERCREVGQLLVGSQVPVTHDGRSRDLEVDWPEQSRVQLGLLAGQLRWRGCGQPNDVAPGQGLDDRLHQVAPERRQVVAFVEDKRRHPAGHEAGDSLARGRREQRRKGDRRAIPARCGPFQPDLSRRPWQGASHLYHPLCQVDSDAAHGNGRACSHRVLELTRALWRRL